MTSSTSQSSEGIDTLRAAGRDAGEGQSVSVVESAEKDSIQSAGNYTKLANFMSKFPEMSIFRRYGSLNVRNILYMQAELAILSEFLKISNEDPEEAVEEASDDVEKLVGGGADKGRSTAIGKDIDADQYWRAMSRKDSSGNHSYEYQLFLEIRGKLKEYNEAVLQYHELCKINGPTKHDLSALRCWLTMKDGGDHFLNGFEGDAWDEGGLEHDLITMSDVHHNRDIFSTWLADHFMHWYQRCFGRWIKESGTDIEKGMYHYKDTKLNAAARFISILIASLMPTMSIFVLYFVDDMLVRLGAITGFSCLFAFTLSTFTRASNTEIFAATAAFASVQVVFVGTTGPSGSASGVVTSS